MSNPYNYPEQYMNSQRDERWKDVHLGHSDVTLGTDGCVVAATAYLLSRYRGHEVTPKDWLIWLTLTNGLTNDGRFKWDWLRMNTSDNPHPLVYQGRNPLGAKYSCQWVQLGQLRHFVVLLKNPITGKVDICFDPWELENHVQSVYKYSRRFEKVYFKIK